LLGELGALLPRFLAAGEPFPLSIIQFLFLMLDPFLAERKFVRFAALDLKGPAARGFVALEDWINDGVPLARRVALDCARSWYRDNDPARGAWQVARNDHGRTASPNSPPHPGHRRSVMGELTPAASRPHPRLRDVLGGEPQNDTFPRSPCLNHGRPTGCALVFVPAALPPAR